MFNSIIKTIILATITSIAILFTSISQSQHSYQPLVWVVSAMEAVERDEPSPATIWRGDRSEEANTIQLMAAKGEYEAFQIVIKAPQVNLEGVNVTVSELTNSEGGTIDPQNINLYREHYIYVDRPSPQGWAANPTLGKGWYADALIPFVNPDTGKDIKRAEIDAVPFNLAAGNNQPIWVDILVPRDAAPGEYQGRFTVESDRGKTTGNILLTVWDFELPVKPSINSLFDVWQDRGENVAQELLSHKVMPGKRIKPGQQVELINEWGLNSVRLPFWSGANNDVCRMRPAPRVEEIKRSSAPYYPGLLKYIYSADEIDTCPSLLEIENSLKQWSKNIHQVDRVKHLVVTKPRPRLYDYIDIWVVQPQHYAETTSEVNEVIQRGDEVWFYTGHQARYSPQWQIDTPPINFRIPQGWIAQSLGLTGVLYWRADNWTDNPWQEVPVYTQGKNNEREFPGDGMLIYPGEEVGLTGVVPSMRLKWIREGVEDYEYTEILKKLGYQDWAMTIVSQVGKDWQNWTKNPDDLYDARRKLAEKIVQLTASN